MSLSDTDSAMTWGELVKMDLVDPFYSALKALQKCSPGDSTALALIELAEVIDYDEKSLEFSRVYENIPGNQGNRSVDLEWTVKWPEIRNMTNLMVQLASQDT